MRKWIVPAIGHRRLGDLAPADSERQRRAGLLTSSQARTHSTLMALLKAAQAEHHAIPANVLAVKPPAKNVSDRTDLPLDMAVSMLGVASQIPQGSRWVAALLQGMRQGECLGLTWDQVDLDRAVLAISWQLQPLPYRDQGRMARDPARAVDGYGVAVVAGDRTGLTRRPGCTTVAGGPCDPKVDDEEWYALQQADGRPHPSGRWYTVHEARHTIATLLLEAGVDPAVIIAILGHTKILTSRGYMHVNTAPLQNALEKVAERLALGSGTCLTPSLPESVAALVRGA